MSKQILHGLKGNYLEKNAAAGRTPLFKKVGLGRTLLAFFLTAILLPATAKENGYGSKAGGQDSQAIVLSGQNQEGNPNLPPLIQTTTLEDDYKARAGLGLAFTRQLSEEDFGQAFQNILCSCVRLKANGHYGSGSILLLKEDEIIIVGNRHLLQYWDEDSFVTFPGGAAESGRVLGISEEADIGFLSVPTGRFPWQELLELRNVRPLGGGAEDGESLLPGGGLLLVDMASDAYHPVMKRGELLSPCFYLEDFGMEMLYGTGEALPGMSGSGVFDGYGNYLGMLTGATMRGEIAAVPVDVIWEEYGKLA